MLSSKQLFENQSALEHQQNKSSLSYCAYFPETPVLLVDSKETEVDQAEIIVHFSQPKAKAPSRYSSASCLICSSIKSFGRRDFEMSFEDSLQYIFHHVFLPPKLPHEEDGRAEHDGVLTQLFHEELKNFNDGLPSQQRPQLTRVIKMVNGIVPREDNTTTPSSEIIKNLKTMKLQDICAIHVEKQNAGIIIQRFEEEYTFETFELSPKNEDVMATVGRLRRFFPGPAVAVSQHRVNEKEFQAALLQCIEGLVQETPIIVHSKISKANTTDIEIRDTIDPTLITSLLTECLHAIGRRIIVRRIQKQTRDVVQWKDCLEPWRRSPRYLFLRVCLQIGLSERETNEPLNIQYKSFMIFFMCRILKRALQIQKPREVLFIMSMKIQRRLLKLEAEIRSDLLIQVQEVLSLVSSHLRESIPMPNSKFHPRMPICRPRKDTVLTLNSLKPYINGLPTRHQSESNHITFKPQCTTRMFQISSCITFVKDSFANLKEDTKEVRLGLADIEMWVTDHLDHWLRCHQTSQLGCTVLADLISNYQEISDRVYEDIAEDQSIKMLTLLDLWVALDKCVTFQEPLLKEYRCGFTAGFFAPLLLPKKPQMIRLKSIERYVTERNAASLADMPCIFSKINTVTSFSVRYFDQSRLHQNLRKRITAEALAERNQKILELNTKLRAFEAWKKKDLLSICETKEFLFGKKENRHRRLGHKPKKCQKCIAKASARRVTVAVHEWPLPTSESGAKSIVFELDVPTTISVWRDRTYSLIVDTFSPKTKEPGDVPYYYLDRSNLSSHFKNSHGRLRLGSKTKPFIASHYNEKPIPLATMENILMPTGLNFQVIDSHGSHAAAISAKFSSHLDIQKLCTIKLAPEFEKLHYFLESKDYSTNEVLANQSKCPSALTLHDYYHFGSLRSGTHLRWLNILREVESQVLDLNREESFLLLAQASWQSSPADCMQPFRESHSDLDDLAFGTHFLEALDKLVSGIESNWQSGGTIRIVTMLTTRMLSISSHACVQESCFDLLLRIRLITITWTRDVVNILHDCREDSELDPLGISVLELALTCNGTFDVDMHHLKRMLKSIESQTVFIETLITVHDRCPMSIDGLSAFNKMLLRLFDRITHRAERILRRMVIWDAEGINTTVQFLWPGYQPGIEWKALETPNERWLRTRTAGCSESASFVDINILTGELLINGSPLARLPHNYETHPTYKRVFGERTLEVIPSTMPGMAFETRNIICDQQIHFGMVENELIVRARRNGECFEVIPKHVLTYDFTNSFVENYIFMRNDETGVIQLRPVETPWISSEGGWQITHFSKPHFNLSNHLMTAVDIRSQLATVISDILRPLEELLYIDMTIGRHNERLEIRLPRFNIDFYRTEDDCQLASKQFRGMSVDENQNIGTFTGLVNKLVLCNGDKSRRIVIIPDGEISFTPHAGHVKVSISPRSKTCCGYHEYKIDTQLGRLVDNGSLYTRLFKSYLHALTSDVLPDTLTAKTGTEEALEILSSAAVSSFYKLSSRETDLLLKLRALSPEFLYYPKHKQSMQTVLWISLPTLSQHEAFSAKVECIFTHARSLIPIQDKLKTHNIPESDTRGVLSLVLKAATRNSFCRVDGFGAEKFTVSNDKEYDSRDGNYDTRRRAAIYDIATLVRSWSQSLYVSKDLRDIMKSLTRPILGPDASTMNVLGYDTQWLDAPSEFLPEHWFSIYQMLVACDESRDKYKVMIFLSTLVFSEKVDDALIHTFLALATNPSFRQIRLPHYELFSLSEGFEPNEDSLINAITSQMMKYAKTPAYKLSQGQSETMNQAGTRRLSIYNDCREDAISTGVKYFMAQWPTEKVVASTDFNFQAYVDISKATAIVQGLFTSWFRNKKFEEYLEVAQATLHTISRRKNITKPWNDYTKPIGKYSPKLTYIALKDLLQNKPPSFFSSAQSFEFESFIRTTKESPTSENDHRNVSELLLELSRHTSGNFESQYNRHFQQSLDALHKMPHIQLESSALSCGFVSCMKKSQIMVREMYLRILKQLVSSIDLFGPIENATILPHLSQTAILSLIADSHSIKISPQWKKAIVSFGLALTALQRLERLATSDGNRTELLLELSNTGHQGWDPLLHSDWLLLELENNILIRKEQARIAKEMILPQSGENSIMQLNMGLGKSSVIVPIVACALADKTKLCRVVVLRALSKQMMELLVNKLGGMINRRIFFVPISRALQINVEEAKQLREIYETCLACGGVLLVQPEHLLSFELMGFDMLLSDDKDTGVGEIMKETQEWLLENSRDILDESDEILNVRFELIYTVGKQQTIDFSPDRWMLIQRVLEILNKSVQNIDQKGQEDFEIESLTDVGAFARFRFMRSKSGNEFLENIAQSICDQGLPGLSFFHFTKTERDTLCRFIIDPKITEKELSGFTHSPFATESMKKSLLLLRGLFAHGVLYFAFSEKRWRVNFGLHLKRSSLAVPYHGKDMPAARSEFSHPETTIILTFLAYYYEGLSDIQAIECFRELLRSDDSQNEYDKWTRNYPNIEAKFKQLSGVNLSDLSQWYDNLYTHLRRSKEMIDFYLSHLVFPKEMKQFPKKLSSSGWDIARHKKYPLTGFSGTNDSKYILPLSVKQEDLPEQLSTNAEVLACLLRPENSFDDTIKGDKFNAETLINLAITSKPRVRVIIDVGAQVLELKNDELASRWLSQLPKTEVQGAVFFDAADELCILNRDGFIERFTISPLSKQVDRCVIYLDEAHTRGTDLRLPTDYRAIVTLGPDLTKDRLVQACMRMRKLGNGQSVCLCAPKEIRRQILEIKDKTQSDPIEIQDVILWCIKNTLSHVQKCIVPWAVQGKCHHERIMILNANPGIIQESIQESEAQTLEERYGFGREPADEHWLSQRFLTTDLKYASKLSDIRQKCTDFGLTSFTDASLQGEQERELQPEKELEVKLEHAPSVPPLPHVLHSDVRKLVISGVMKRDDSADSGFISAFNLFRLTSAKKLFNDCGWPNGLWTTMDYARTFTGLCFSKRKTKPAVWSLTLSKSMSFFPISGSIRKSPSVSTLLA
ncbi:hypothetical protein BOTCAL_0677g00030 [Botryotinia calthae]|uniref:ubiquitinyl hydrolase 1 n=1 Tax=Botryotinia calthae TaxID=38488 RepID=A0A4Y8CIA1_9HELO|nr:hypothetical protein BOTCAL_0677g00030 [Botryotinia calthae]